MNRAIRKLRTKLRKHYGVPFMTATTIARAYNSDGSWGLKYVMNSKHATFCRVDTWCSCCGPQRWSFKLPGAEVEITLAGQTINGKDF